MDTKLARKTINWMNEALNRADNSNDIKTKVDADNKYIRTPWDLCEQMISKISLVTKLISKKILVIDTVEFIPVLLTFGVEKCNITFVAPYNYKGNRIAGIIGVKVVQQSFLDWSTNMKFDITVGNPPYQDDTNSNLYKCFVRKAKQMSDVVALIVPSSNFKDEDEFLNLRDYSFKGSYFPSVQLHVSWFIWDKNYHGSTTVSDLKGNTISTSNILVAPTTDLKRFALVNQLLAKKHKGWTIENGKLSRNKAILDSNGIWCIWSGGRKDQDFDKVLISTSQADMLSGVGNHKVVFSGDYTTTAIGPIKYAPPDHGCAMKAHYISVDSESTARNLIGYLNSKFIRYIVADIKGTSTKNGKTVFKKIPEIDITRGWIDADIYSHFGLTQDEINHIEITVK
jgi:site-specific DNA-methyltransferase (adenine-specific)